MPTTEFVAGMDEIIRPVAAFLKEAGFRKSGRNFNRAVGDGVVQVLAFQMGRHEFRTQEVPGFAGNLHGRFTVNLGIVTPCLQHFDAFMTLEPGKVVSEIACSIRERIGQVMPEHSDIWWAIRPPYEVVAEDVGRAIRDHGLPFLERFRDYAGVLAHHARHGQLPGIPSPRSALIIGLIHCERGDREAARAAFREARTPRPHGEQFCARVAALEAELLGFNGT